MEKEENAHNEQYLLFQQCFHLNQVIVSPYVHIFDITSLFAAELEEPKISISGIGSIKSLETVMKRYLISSLDRKLEHFLPYFVDRTFFSDDFRSK